jgi:N-acetyl-gamma-glutamyl-phosphate reductase
MNMKVGIFGTTGYAGMELVDRLVRHPHIEVVFATSESYAGQSLAEVYPQGPAWPLIRSEDAPLGEVDLVFLCLPHAASAATAVRALAAGCQVIDLSADFRLLDVATYEKWYKVTHPAPELLDTAVYGLTEHARPALRQNPQLVACPGCYPTSILLPLQPLVVAGAINPHAHLIADAKSGVTGAGRSPKLLTHFAEVSDNLTPYSIGQTHRHWVEMTQVLQGWATTAEADVAPLIFTPHLIAIPRGILSTIYVPLAEGWDEAQVRQLFAVYADEPFVTVLPPASWRRWRMWRGLIGA